MMPILVEGSHVINGMLQWPVAVSTGPNGLMQVTGE